MKLKKRIKSLDEVDEKYQDLYVEKDGEFVLEMDDEDTGALKRAKEHEKSRRQEAEKKLRETQEKMEELENRLDEMSGDDKDPKKVEERISKKFQKEKETLESQVESLNSEVNRLLVENVSSSLASELSDTPRVLEPHIRSRLRAEKGEDGKFKTVVLDENGEVSSSSLDDLRSELQGNSDFAGVIKASDGSGSGANRNRGDGGSHQPEKIDFSKASNKELTEHFKAQREARESQK